MSARLSLQPTDDSSDYGSDFDIEEAGRLLDALHTADSQSIKTIADAKSSARSNVSVHSIQRPEDRFGIVAPDFRGRMFIEFQAHATEFSETCIIPARDKSSTKFESEKGLSGEAGDGSQSPLERFRTAPKKPLSVTDIVSPAWCELQYLNNLRKYGRIKRTAAMKRGSTVHKSLENEVHRTVPVDVKTREDHWGLRLWNCIQGLRTLQTTGMTRELEIWGVFEGQVVNGVIDELSYMCSTSTTATCPHPSPGFPGRGQDTLAADQSYSKQMLHDCNRKLHLKDVKTRASPFMPKHSNTRPSRMQLMMYKKILSENANDRIASNILFKRYNLDPFLAFSDTLIAQLSELEPFQDDSSAATVNEGLESNKKHPFSITRYNTLSHLWNLMITHYKLCLPLGAESIGDTLYLEYRLGDTGEILGSTKFEYNEREIADYVADELKWWRGEREPRGVEVEEAFKCGMCEFADNCSWRLDKVEATLERAKRRKATC